MQGLYLHRTVKHRKTNTNISAISEILTQDLSDKAIKAYSSLNEATGTGKLYNYVL
jgi:hypothetical protein